jgi:hypothetical protein
MAEALALADELTLSSATTPRVERPVVPRGAGVHSAGGTIPASKMRAGSSLPRRFAISTNASGCRGSRQGQKGEPEQSPRRIDHGICPAALRCSPTYGES